MGHEPDGDGEHNEQVGQHDEITSITSKKIVACESGGVKSKDDRDLRLTRWTLNRRVAENIRRAR
jgi:hypothetical protein